MIKFVLDMLMVIDWRLPMKTVVKFLTINNVRPLDDFTYMENVVTDCLRKA